MNEKPSYTTEELMEHMERRHPGFRALVAEARAEFHARYPDPEERRRVLLAHMVHVDEIAGLVQDPDPKESC